MKTIKQIETALAEFEADSRLCQPPATIFENGPLALVQVDLEAKISTLKWALRDGRSPHRAGRGT